MNVLNALYLLLALTTLVATEKADQKRQRLGNGKGTNVGGSFGHRKGATKSAEHGKVTKKGGRGGGSGRGASGCGGGRPQRLNFTEANKHIDCLIKNRSIKLNDSLKNQTAPDLIKQKACHSMAMLRCGCTALITYNAELDRAKTVPLETKCSIRANFFRCVDESEKSHCRHPKHKPSYKTHMKKIVSVLWSTRVCLLGAFRDADADKRDYKVNSSFCANINGGGKGAKKKGKGKAKGKSKDKAKDKSTQILQ